MVGALEYNGIKYCYNNKKQLNILMQFVYWQHLDMFQLITESLSGVRDFFPHFKQYPITQIEQVACYNSSIFPLRIIMDNWIESII